MFNKLLVKVNKVFLIMLLGLLKVNDTIKKYILKLCNTITMSFMSYVQKLEDKHIRRIKQYEQSIEAIEESIKAEKKEGPVRIQQVRNELGKYAGTVAEARSKFSK